MIITVPGRMIWHIYQIGFNVPVLRLTEMRPLWQTRPLLQRKKLSLLRPPQNQKRPQEKMNSVQLVIIVLWLWKKKWGCRTTHVLQVAAERFIVVQRVSVKRAWRMNDLLMGSLLHFLALCIIQTPCLLCSVKVMCGYTHHSRKSCHCSLFGLMSFSLCMLSNTFSLENF